MSDAKSNETPLKVLLVDDDLSLRGVTAARLRKAGYDVEVAPDGQKGLEAALEIRPDVIVSDVMMPVMDGVEFLKRSRKEESIAGCYFILLTAKDQTADMLVGFEASADDYLTKPFKMAELIVRVRAGGRLKRSQDQLKRTNIALREALRQRAELLGVVAHDLRSPVSIITTYIALLGEGIVPDEDIKEVCLRRAQGITSLLDGVLDISKIDAGMVLLNTEDVHASLCVRESKVLYQPVAQKRDMTFDIEIPDALHLVCDRTRLIEVLNMLFDLAIRLCQDRSTIQGGLSIEGEELVFQLCFPCTHVPDELRGEMFDPDQWTGHRELNANILLNLSIVRRLLEIMGGKAMSVAGDGDTLAILVRLPLAP